MDHTYKPKSFWTRPEGVTGAVFLIAIIGGLGFLLFTALPAIISLTSSILGLAGIIAILGILIFMALDSKARALVGYMYKSVMRWITSLFIEINPIAILKNYVEEMTANLKKMNKQILKLRGQMHKLKELMLTNEKDINTHLTQAQEAKKQENRQVVILKSRKAGRLKESNMKYEQLYKQNGSLVQSSEKNV